MNSSKIVRLPGTDIKAPAFLPDATFGVVRSADVQDLIRCGVQGLVMNTFHLMQRPGSSTVRALGGLHQMSAWQGAIVTDSGGFQAYSLIRENPKHGSITDRGISFQPDRSQRKFNLTPEKTVQLQLSFGTNVVVCLDDCTNPSDPFETQVISVRRTIDWAHRCKKEFQRILNQKSPSTKERPLLFGVIQGGNYRDLRDRCASELLEIGFDGFGFGGWPLDAERNLLIDTIGYTRELIPMTIPMHALGIGHPLNLIAASEMGYDLFDSALPTRDARRGRLYSVSDGLSRIPSEFDAEWFSYLYISDKKHIKANYPIFQACDCACCQNYSVGYLHHLFKIKDSLFFRMSTIHNLRFMVLITEALAVRDSQAGRLSKAHSVEVQE